MPSNLVKLFGTDEPPAETRLLRAGPLSVELDAGNLRYIRYDGHEAIRAVSYVVRDQYWGTFNPEIADFEVETDGDGFSVTYKAVCRDATQAFGYRAKITGSPDGTLVFEGVGMAESDFLTNRTGFVVLHPVVGVSGRPVEVLHADGSSETVAFPEHIDPKQPILGIRALTHEVVPGLKACCTMEGDTFEMEDQRNWTDASYKTYVRPLDLPFPYTIEAGQSITQSVTVSFEGSPSPSVGTRSGGRVEVSVGAPSGRLPAFGMALDPDTAKPALDHPDELAALKPGFISCLIDLRSDPLAALADFRAVGDAVGAPVGLEAIVPDDADPAEALGGLAQAAATAGLAIESVAVTSAGDLNFVMPGAVFPDSKDFDALYAAAREAFPEAKLGGGNFVYFTELNRKQPPFDQLDFVCHTTCAIVHAADDRSVTETIESLPFVVNSARAMFGEKPYRMGPSGIATRTAPFGSDPTPNPRNNRVTMTRRDPRQRGLLGAAWHLGYAARMAEGGVNSVILGAPVGEFGLLYHDMGYDQPWYAEQGQGLYPAYHVMRGMYGGSARPYLSTTVSAPREVQAVGFQTEAGLELWLANLTGEARQVEVAGLAATTAGMAALDAESFEAAAGDPGFLDASEAETTLGTLNLEAYAVARLRVAD